MIDESLGDFFFFFDCGEHSNCVCEVLVGVGGGGVRGCEGRTEFLFLEMKRILWIDGGDGGTTRDGLSAAAEPYP